MASLKLQRPLTINGNNIYPLTTYDQIIMSDGKKWNGKAGSDIQIEPLIASGTKLATITVDGVSKDLWYQASTVNLNGTATTSAKFYAPTVAGTSGYVLKSNGSGAPTWMSPSWLPLTGGTLTGVLNINNDAYPRIAYNNAAGAPRGLIYYSMASGEIGTLRLRVYTDDTGQNYKTAYLDANGTFYSTGFSGSGASLTSLNASNISSGTIAAARLPVATASELGAVKVGANITVSNGTIKLAKSNILNALEYVPLSTNGGTVTGTITSSVGTGTYLAGNEGTAIINSTATGYVMLAKMNSTNGVFTLGAYQTHFELHYTANSTITAGTNTVTYGINLLQEDGASTFNKLYGAVWNDYAEYRGQNETIEPGYITYCDDDGKLKKTTERLQKYEGVVSDTFGFAIGETDDCKTPIAVSGRALVYCNTEETFHAGDCVCAGPDGLACYMTREEIIEFPDRIVGVVSEIPTYETWGSGNVAVNGRIWIKVK